MSEQKQNNESGDVSENRDDTFADAVDEIAREMGEQEEGGKGNGCGCEDASGAEENNIEAELQSMADRLLRTQAELENFRKRSRRELEESRRYANFPLMRDLLAVVDNIGRAITAAEQAGEAEELLAGFQMVATQLDTILEQYGCKKIEAEGADFDPHLHESISQMPSEEFPKGAVLHVTLVGYTLHDRVVRAAQVVVSSGPAAEE